MPTLAQLGHLLTACRIVTPEQWRRAAERGAGGFAETLDALTAETPDWWPAGAPDPPPGLSDYQRGVIELWFESDGSPPHRQLALNQFLLLDKLGQGGQGAVFRARQLSPARFVAVKTLTRDTDSARQRFEQEARAMMKVQHPAVARFHLYERVRDALGKPTDEYLIAMEYVEGTDLHRLLQSCDTVPWPFVARWAAEVLGGLAAIHRNGFIHRDIKPANVMILGPVPGPGAPPSATSAKLLDFGAVKSAESAKSGTRRVFVGTREYAPYEQWGGRVVPGSDIYALGGTLFHALTGRPPYRVEGREVAGFMRAHARGPIPSAHEFNPDVPEGLSILIQRMLAKQPDERGTAADLEAEFRTLLPTESRTEVWSPPEVPKRGPKPVAPKTRPAPEPKVEEQAEDRGLVGAVLGTVERIFLPPDLRPVVGHEPPAAERVAALLRRPLVLLTLVVVLALLIFLLM